MKSYKTKIPAYRLAKTQSDLQKVKITCSRDAADYARQFFADDIEIYESVFILLLNRANNTIGWAKISQGGISGSVIDVKIILKYAVESLASSAILVHNHPSGEIRPSDADIRVTERIKKAMKMIDTTLIEHIILT